MFRVIPVLALAGMAWGQASKPAKPVSEASLRPVQVLQGRWKVTRAGASAPDDLVNDCATVGRYFACQQTVNGAAGALLIISSAGEPGKYFTQNVLPEGRATGRDDLEIAGEKWVWSSRRLQAGHGTLYRTLNVFNGHDRIHFEQQESTDNGGQWVTKASGDEVRVK